MQPLISIIVPVYNVDLFLERCIESIVKQTYKNLEIILIDDGSTDKSALICDNWEKKDQRIKVIHKENGGLSDARNCGMQEMHGEYVLFVDSDDWIEQEMIEILYLKLKEKSADICECKFRRVSTEMVHKNNYRNSCITVLEVTHMESVKKCIKQEIQPVVWNKIYKQDVIKDTYFPVGKCNEDEFWTYKVIDKCKKIIQIDCVLYNYFVRDNSIINQKYSLKRLDGLEGRYQRMLYFKKYPEIYLLAKNHMFFECMYHYQMALLYLDTKEKKESSNIIFDIKNSLHISYSDFLKYDGKEKIWFILGKISFKNVCKFRNLLRYGI